MTTNKEVKKRGAYRYDIWTDSQECYDDFIKQHPKLKKDVPTRRHFEKYLRAINKNVYKYIRDTGLFVELPYGFGLLGLTKHKTYNEEIMNKNPKVRRTGIDWGETKKQGKKVFYNNMHTDGYKVSHYWHTVDSRMPFAYAFRVLPIRDNRKDLGQFLLDSNHPYRHEMYIDNPYKKWYELDKELKRSEKEKNKLNNNV